MVEVDVSLISDLRIVQGWPAYTAVSHRLRLHTSSGLGVRVKVLSSANDPKSGNMLYSLEILEIIVPLVGTNEHGDVSRALYELISEDLFLGSVERKGSLLFLSLTLDIKVPEFMLRAGIALDAWKHVGNIVYLHEVGREACMLAGKVNAGIAQAQPTSNHSDILVQSFVLQHLDPRAQRALNFLVEEEIVHAFVNDEPLTRTTERSVSCKLELFLPVPR